MPSVPGTLAAPISNRTWLIALTGLLLGTLVKWTPVVMAMFCLLAWMRCLPDWRQRLVWLGRASAMLGGIALLVSAPWLKGLLMDVANLDGADVGYSNWLMDVPAAWFAAHVLDRTGIATEEARATARALFTVPAVAFLLVWTVLELRNVWRVAVPNAPRETIRAILAATARTMLVVLVVVSPQVQQWYFSWPLALGLLLGWRDTTARVAIAYSLLFPLVVYIREQTGDNPVDPLLVLYAVLPLTLPALAWLRRHPGRLSEAS